MPRYVKNTGMSSLNELFAMKKNLAYETKFEHRLSGMNRDFFNKKENLKQEIRTVYNELKMIQASTGHSLKQTPSAVSDDTSFRQPNMPTIYFPPIGVKLVKKYTGIDVKRHSLANDNSPTSQLHALDSLLNLTLGVSKTDSTHKKVDSSKKLPAARKVEFLVSSHDDANEEVKDKQHNTKMVDEQQVSEVSDQIAAETTSETLVHRTTSDIDGIGSSFLQRNEQQLDETAVFNRADHTEHESEDECVTEKDLNEQTIEMNGKEGTLCVEREYNLIERRSSRSTFRGRSSTRLPSRSNLLSEYNLGVVALSKRNSEKTKKKPLKKKKDVGHFYLDYGNGKLHDSMEIPKMKDCARPWCNPHCKTCRNRTFSRPCFVLIPAEENVRKRKIPQDNRRPSIYPANLSKMPTEEGTEENGKDDQSFTGGTTKTSVELRNSNADDTETTDLTNTGTEIEKGEVNHDEKENQDGAETEQVMQRNKSKPNKGYSKKRLEELAQPRGGPPAEVRFSKWSLRKKQEELVEDESRKALTKYERGNLINIQGKISMFLALLNEKEIVSKPVKMVDIPVRMDVGTRNTKNNEAIKQKRQKNVHLYSKPRLLS